MNSNSSSNKETQPKPPNEANNSFVKSVTSRMTGLLPSTITKWFSSPSSSKSNGSAPIAESTDSSTEDEAPESPTITQPPAKRMRYTSPGTSHTYHEPETKCKSTNTESVEMYDEIQSPTNRPTFQSETKYVSTPMHSSSEESTSSGIKKIAPIYNLDNSFSYRNNSVVKRRKSLFNIVHEDKTALELIDTEDPALPRYKPMLFASPFNKSRAQYCESPTFMNQPNIKQRKNASVTESSNNDDNTISQSSKRIFELLENYSSPLIEAQRISQLLRNTTNETLNISSLADSSVGNSRNLSYKAQELPVPSFATILRIKQRSRLMKTTSAIRQLIASHSSSSDFKAYPQPESQSSTPKEMGDKQTTKMKSKLTRINREERNQHETVEPINLPTAVLQIDKNNLPKFSLGIPPSNPPSISSTATTSTITSSTDINTFSAISPIVWNKNKNVSIINETTVNNTEKPYNNKDYHFSSPVTVSNETVTNISTTPIFTFGSPERTTEPNDNAASDNHNQVVPEKIESTLPTQSENWKCDDCWVVNNRDANICVCCAGKKPVKDKINTNKCTMCKVDLSTVGTGKCADCQKKNNIITKQIITDKTQWKCQDCWVMNDEGVEKCVCCGGKKPGPVKSTMSVTNEKSDNIENDWKCDVCWIKNKSNAVKCVACDAPNPASKSFSNKSNKEFTEIIKSTKNDSLLKSIAKSQSDKWECPNCLVRNESNVSKCACCETDKPGTIKESEKKSFNFGVVPNTTFKFGIDPKLNNAEKVPKSTPVSLNTPVIEFETNNNDLTPTFTFELPKKRQKDNSKKVKEKTEDIAKPAFTFGIPKQVTTDPATKSDLNNSGHGGTKLFDETPKDFEKKVEGFAFNKFGLPKMNQICEPIKPVDSLVEPTTSQPSVSKDNPFKITLPSYKPSNDNLEKNEPVNNNNSVLVSKLTTTAETSLPQSTFTFSSSSIKPSLNLFAPQVTATATTSSTFSAAEPPPISSSISFFQKTVPSSSSNLSFFQKDNSTSSSMSLFNKPETTVTTTAAQSSVSNTSLFSFSNTPNSMTQPEKPKFNFTFGSSNKSETSSIFKGPFVTNTETIGGNFSLGNSNTMMPNSNMSGSLLSGGSVLPAGNPLGGISTGNGLEAGNSLSGNVLSSNTAGNNLVHSNNQSTLPTSGLFGSIKKDNMWSSSNSSSNNMFMSNVMDNNNVPKPSFNFGSSISFNSNNPNQTPVFGSPAQPTQNVFGMASTNSQPSLFSNQIQNPAPPSIFGTPQPANNPVPAVGLFGTPNVGVTPTFGSPNPVPTFETTMNPAPAPAPAFNFGGQQQSTGIFGFGQQQQQQQPQQQTQQHQTGVYNFGASPAGMAQPQVQFSMGSVPNIPGRRVRKAIRRTTQR